MENRARNMFALLTIVFAFALHSISAEDVTTSNLSPTTTSPSGSPTHIDLPSVQKENIAKPEQQISQISTNNNSSIKLINIEVYYEALCNDSVQFVSQELLPVYNKLKKFIDVIFIPFAKGNITFIADKPNNITCDRTGECIADIVHACGINKIKDNEKLIKFVNCSLTEGFKSPNHTIPVEACVKNSNVDSSIINEINQCANTYESWMPLLQNYKNLSSNANVKSVPKVLIDKVPIENLKTNELMTAVCRKIINKDLPDDCKTFVNGSDKLVVGILPIIIGAFYIIKMI